MGSRLSRRRSLDKETQLSKRRRQLHGSGETGGSGSRGGRHFVFTSLIRRSDKLPEMLRKTIHSPYVRRVAWIREIQKLLREHKVDQASDVLKLLRKDMGLEGTSLNDILYKNAAFLNLVDPISHELLLGLARDMQCPKKYAEPLKSSDKICRQLIYHLTPHSKWARQGTPQRKSQACLKTTLQRKLCTETVDLSGIPLSGQDVHQVAHYLQNGGDSVATVDLSFTELQDESLRLLLPFLGSLPRLATLALNGNRLTAAVVKDLTEAAKSPGRFTSLSWVDLGNNVDIFTMPQPLLVALRRRLGLKSSLPTIYEYTEGQPYCYTMESSIEEATLGEEEEEEEEEEPESKPEVWGPGENVSPNFTLHYCESMDWSRLSPSCRRQQSGKTSSTDLTGVTSLKWVSF